MKIKVIMSDKAMSRETMDAREKMLKVALSSDAEVSVEVLSASVEPVREADEFSVVVSFWLSDFLDEEDATQIAIARIATQAIATPQPIIFFDGASFIGGCVFS